MSIRSVFRTAFVPRPGRRDAGLLRLGPLRWRQVLNADTNGTFSASGDDLIFYSDVREPAAVGNVYDVVLAIDEPLAPGYAQGWDGWQCW